ncbi:MAG: PKD domain-containing protein [Bacteroidetes bacterium]|nr:MAG: PKD domain-containing protein [Bacteroidota bacterium]
MKKITLCFSLLFSAGVLFAQSQRLVFVEEFTQASCGPCASANPSFNALLSTNTTKAASLKYQVSWPGTDPMNAQNTADVTTRVTYYGVSGVPDARLNGNVAAGAPGVVTQTNINSEYALPSPFSMKLDHWFNAANDSIYINCEITCTQNTNMTTPRVRIAMIEKTITFANAPGSNGEKVFYNVMRKMYPNANGTALATAWTSGQKKTISFKEKIPAYIYSKPQIGVVAFIQDDSNKNIKQSAFSSSPGTPLALPPVADFMANTTTTCDGIINFSDQSALFPTSWAWWFGDGGASILKNPIHKYSTSGTYAVSMTATNANGNNNIVKTGYITVNLAGTAPTGVNDNICSNGVANLSATPAGSGALNWYNYNGAMVNTGNTYNPTVVGTTDFWVAEMTPNAVKAEGEPDNTLGAGTTFTATVTHGLYFDVLKSCRLVSVATYASAAGNHTIQVMDAAGIIVKTATVNIPTGLNAVTLNFDLPAGTGYFLHSPNPANLYRNTAGASYPYNTSGVVSITGNDVGTAYYYFFYDWKVQQNPCASPGVLVSALDTCTSTGINDITVINSLVVYPNPGNGVFTASFNTARADNYSVKISNTFGQAIYEEALSNFVGAYSKEINISAYGKGVYILSISNSKEEDVKKVITF